MAVIAAAAISAAGAIGGGVIASQGAKSAAAASRPQTQTIQLPKYQRGLQSYFARLLSQNVTAVPPSFTDYISSGGTAQFPIVNPGMTPKEAKQLGIVGKRGQEIPFFDPNASALTPEQKLFLGEQEASRAKFGTSGFNPNNPLVRAFNLNKKIARLAEGDPQNPTLTDLRGRRDRLLNAPNLPKGGLA